MAADRTHGCQHALNLRNGKQAALQPKTETKRQAFDMASFEAGADDFAGRFRSATPFPHIVLDGLVGLDPADAESFPQPSWSGWKQLGDTYQHNKHYCDDPELIPEPFQSLINELSRPRFLRALEAVTGIKRLLPDPYLAGGGLHLSGPGGVLAPHTDFHHYRAMDLYRRINVLVYFNEDWEESYGGCLELTADGSPNRSLVVPDFGRVVIFQTDDQSVHGFPVPITEGRWRRSLALYYYTAAEAPNFSGDATTYWREHGEQSGVRRLRLALYRTLLNLSRGISLIAHVVNPNQGAGLVKTVLANRKRG